MKIKSIIGYAIISVKKPKIDIMEIYDTDEIKISKDEKIIKVEIKQWKK